MVAVTAVTRMRVMTAVGIMRIMTNVAFMRIMTAVGAMTRGRDGSRGRVDGVVLFLGHNPRLYPPGVSVQGC